MPTPRDFDGTPPVPAIPYATFASEVLELYDFRAKKTIAKMRQVLREFGELGIATAAELRPVHVARWRKAHPDRAPATVHSLLRSFRAACEIGVASGYLAASPLIRQVWPDDPGECEPREKHHAIAEIRAVLLHLRSQVGYGWHEHRLYALAAIVAYTGMRKMEALRLTIPDVDLDRRCIRIVPREKKLKTRASGAPVGMPDDLAETLEHWVPRTGSIWVVPNVSRAGPWTGGPPGHKPLDRLKAEALRAGVAGFTFQSLRHSWATHGEYWGLGETMIQRQLRHTTKRTQQVYRHADLANLASSVRSISFRLDEGRSSAVPAAHR